MGFDRAMHPSVYWVLVGLTRKRAGSADYLHRTQHGRYTCEDCMVVEESYKLLALRLIISVTDGKQTSTQEYP